MVKYGTRPVRDVVIFGIIVKYGTRPVRDVDIMQYYDKNMRHCGPPPPQILQTYFGPEVRQLETLLLITNNIFKPKRLCIMGIYTS